MNIQGIESGLVGFALFDMYESAVKKAHKGQPKGDPLVAAACEAFEHYLDICQTQHTAQIDGLATYALTPKGGSQLITSQQMAPFLALNLMA